MTEKSKTNPKAPKFKVDDRVRLTKYKNIFSKVYSTNWSRKIFVINSVLKNNPWIYKVIDLNESTQKVNKLKAESFASRLKQIDLVHKINFNNKLTSCNRQSTLIKTKH